MQHSMIWVGTGVMPEGSTPEKTNRIASYSGAMAQSNMDQPNIGPGDRQTAVFLGKRVAEAAVRWTSAIAAHPEQIPTKWSPKEGVLWSVATPGHGQSSPVSWEDKVFVTSTVGPKKDEYYVMCFSSKDGKELWNHKFNNSDPVENSVYVSRAAPTPVVDKDRIVAFFESGDIVAIDHKGTVLWKSNMADKFGKFKNKFGLSGSLTQNQKNVFILVDDEGPSYLVALEKASGKEVWKQDRSPRNSWSSPAMHTIDGVEQIVVSSAGTVDGYECATGKLLWSFSDVGGNTGCTPVSIGNGKFFVAASAGRDGGNAEMARKSNTLMQVSKQSGAWTTAVLWKAEEATPSWASPIEHQGCAYWVNRTGVIYCFDTETGKLNYKERSKQSCWATPYGVGDRVYFFGKDGLTTVVAAGKEFRTLSENELWDPNALPVDKAAGANESTEERRNAAAMFSGPTLYGFAIVGDKIIARTGEKLFCIGN